MNSSPKATAVVASKLLCGLGASTAHPIAYLPLPDPVDGDCTIRDYKVLGSYNWLNGQPPTIAIPGQPRIWKEPSLPLQLSLDRGYHYHDQNAWRCQESPLEPIFRSVSVTQQLIGNTSFSLSEQQIDVVTDRNNLRQLSEMIRSMRTNQTLTASKSRELRIDAQLAPNGRTLLLTRYTERPRRLNQGDNSYGVNFERATTSNYTRITISNHNQPEHKRLYPTSYHRIAKYSLGDLKLLVRYEVDAAQHASSTEHPSTSKSEKPSHEQVETQPHSTLQHIVSGSLISQDRIMELKTGIVGKLKWTKIRPQLYFSQTSILKVGFHENGNFSKLEDRALEPGQNLIDDLKLLVPFLKQMKHACQQHGHSGKPLAFFWSGVGPLQLYELKHSKQSRSLPKEVLDSI